MQLFSYISIPVLAVFMIALHILSAVFCERKVFNYVNIALHIAFVFPMLLLGVELTVLVLSFMTSYLVYILSHLVSLRLRSRTLALSATEPKSDVREEDENDI